jgi:hypothetical protein
MDQCVMIAGQGEEMVNEHLVCRLAIRDKATG